MQVVRTKALRSYRTADLGLSFPNCKRAVFLCSYKIKVLIVRGVFFTFGKLPPPCCVLEQVP